MVSARPLGGARRSARQERRAEGPMPAERVSMRRIREVLRLKHEGGASDRQIARSLSLARNTVALTLERAAVGPNTAKLIALILESRPHPEQGYRAAIGILRLARHYGADRLEAACERGLDIG